MKNKFTTAFLAITFLLFSLHLSATTFTAIASGDWTDSATWDGDAPTNLIIGEDVIVIPEDIVVKLNTDIQINSNLASLLLEGTLTSVENKINLLAGAINGNGEMTLKELKLGSGSIFGCTGLTTLETLDNAGNHSMTSTELNISKNIKLQTGILSFALGCTLNCEPDLVVNVKDGTMIQGEGLINLNGDINIVYSGTSTATGVEIASNLVNDVTISLSDPTASVYLQNNLFVKGNLLIETGILDLSGYNLLTDGNILTQNSGKLSLDKESNLTINGEILTPLLLTDAADTCRNLIVNNQVKLGANIQVSGDLILQGGQLSLEGFDLTVHNQCLVEAGTLKGNYFSNITFLALSGDAGQIGFSEDVNCNNFTTHGPIMMTSDMTVNGLLNIVQKELILNANTLGINGTIIPSQGSLFGDTHANIRVMSGVFAGSLNFTENAAICNNLEVDGFATLGTDLKVTGGIKLIAGELILNEKTLEIEGNIKVDGTGKLSGDYEAVIILSGQGDSGELPFKEGQNVVKELVINMPEGSIKLNSTLLINEKLSLLSGHLILQDGNLLLGQLGEIEGGSVGSYVSTQGQGHLTANVDSGASTMFPIGTEEGYFPCNISQNEAAATNLMVRATPGVFAEGWTGTNLAVTESMVDNTWLVSATDEDAVVNLNFELFWNDDAEVNGFDMENCYISHYTENGWDVETVTAANVSVEGFQSVTRSNITSLSPFRVVDGDPVGVFNQAQIDFKIYPNPTTEWIAIEVPENLNPAFVRILTMQGQAILNENLTKKSTIQLDIKTLPNGTYIIALDGATAQRFTKQ